MQTFITSTFFRNVETFDTQKIDVDFKKGNRQLAPFVHKKIGGVTIDNEGYETNTYEPPLVAPNKITTVDDILKRTPGERDVYKRQDPYGAYNEDGKEKTQGPALSVAMETTIKSSAFERAMKLEDQLNKVHGRIIKLLDTIKSYELEQRRIALEEKRYALMKQKISGEYDVDPDTGEIDDSYTEDSEDGEV